MQQNKYFAYGSNLDTAQMRRRCPAAQPLGPAHIPNTRIEFSRYSEKWSGGVANITPTIGCEVWGLIYELSDADLAALDRFEGCPTVYARTLTTVVASQPVEAWAYHLVGHYTFHAPSDAYVQVILRACALYGFPESYQREVATAAAG